MLGAGFLEKVYQRALMREIVLRALNVTCQATFPVGYKGQRVGEYIADLLIEDKLIVELKCVDQFANEHLAQCINYLKASRIKLASLINFQKPRWSGRASFTVLRFACNLHFAQTFPR